MPLKRHIALQGYSREHHLGLLLGWKVRQGIRKEVSWNRIIDYCINFYNNHLLQHMQKEEDLILSKLSAEDKDVKRILEEHDNLALQFNSLQSLTSGIEDALIKVVDALDDHIRFEEREFFTRIQEEFSEEELNTMEPEELADAGEPEDEFWK